MSRYNDFINFAEKHNYFFNDEEKRFFQKYFLKKPVKFSETFGKRTYFNLILAYFKENNIYNNAFNPMNV